MTRRPSHSASSHRIAGALAAGLVLLAVPSALAAQTCAANASPVQSDLAGLPPVLEALLGRWEGSGTLMGTPARFRMTWSRALGGRFLRLEFENAFAADGGAETPVLRSMAHYRLTSEGPVVGTWSDDRGAILTLCAEVSDGAFVVTWTAPDETGRTVYRPADGALHVVDSVRTPDGWREFGRAELRAVSRRASES